MPEPHGFCSLFCCPVWPVAAFLTSHWCVKSFRLLANSLAEQVVNLFLMKAVLDNCLWSAKYSGLCSTSGREHQGDKLLLCLSGLHFFFSVDSAVFWGAVEHGWVKAEELVQVMVERRGKGQAVVC